MGTITPRKRKDNSVRYTAHIRINRDGRTVYQESQTFNRKQLAKAWIKRREAEPDRPDAVDHANYKSATLTQMIDRYLIEYEAVRPPGKTKRVTLTVTSKTPLSMLCIRVDSFAKWVMALVCGVLSLHWVCVAHHFFQTEVFSQRSFT